MLHAQSQMLLGVESEEREPGTPGSDSSTSATAAASGEDSIPPNSPTISDSEVRALFDELNSDQEQDLPEQVGDAPSMPSTEKVESKVPDQEQDLSEQVGEAPGTPTTEKVKSKVPCMINGVANHWSCVKCTQALSC